MKRHSRQRDCIRAELATRRDHPTAEDIYLAIKGDYPRISLATVYRNLCQMVAAGEILEIAGGGAHRYDAFTAPHDHVRCTQCRRVFDVPSCAPGGGEALLARAKENFGGTVTGYRLQFEGICPDCLQKGSVRSPEREDNI
jgi:Fur family peroxide stress response transcriptional regulator